MGLTPSAVAPLDDLDGFDAMVGDARVVAIGESGHYNAESYRLRHRLLRRLVERHGFSTYAMESGFVEGRRVDAWVRGGADRLDDVLANGLTSLMGPWREMRAHLEWMRRHNDTAARPVGFAGIDLPGSNASLLPGLDAVLAHLAQADPGYAVDPGVRETAAEFAATSAFSAAGAFAAYTALDAQRRDALTAALAGLGARVSDEHLRRSLDLTVALDAMFRAAARGDQEEMTALREAAVADTVSWIADRSDRVVVAAHNLHVQRCPAAVPGMPAMTPMGVRLAERLGADYLVVGVTAGGGQGLNTGPDFATGTLFADLEPARPDSLDALLDASHDGPFLTDLRRLSPADTAAVRAATHQRAGVGALYTQQCALDAFDVVAHLPRVTPAEPDPEALACAPAEVREPFARWATLSCVTGP